MDRLLREGNPPAGQLASPKPQYKDVQTNNWEELKGEGGASYVKDKDVFAKLEQARVLLNAISGKDFATQTTLAAVLAKLADLESELATIKANQLSGDQKVQLSGHIQEFAVASWDDLPDPSEVPVGATAQLIGTFDVRQNTGTEWVEVVL